MSYLEFLARPQNLVFLAAAAAAAALYLVERVGDRDLFRIRVGLVALAVTGLTLNGAIHDLSLGALPELFPRVVAISVPVAVAAAWAIHRLRERLFPRVRRVRFNEPGLTGVEARVVSRRVDSDPGSGRAHWHDGEGVLHIVRCHTEGGSIGFGKKVRLEEFRGEEGSYRVRTI